MASSGTFKAAANGDDGYWTSASGFNNSQYYSYIGKITSTYSHFSRFASVNIPQGAVITSAVVKFRSYASRSADTIRVKISAIDADDAAAPTSASDAEGKTLTSAQVDWDFTTDWDSGGSGIYSTPDIKIIIQEIVDRAGWSSGNHIVIFVKDDGSDSNANRVPDAHEGGTTREPQLYVEWETDKIYDFPASSVVITGSGKPSVAARPPAKALEITGAVTRYFCGQKISVPAVVAGPVGSIGIPKLTIAIPSKSIEAYASADYVMGKILAVPSVEAWLAATANEKHGPFIKVTQPATVEVTGSASAQYANQVQVPPLSLEIVGSLSGIKTGTFLHIPSSEIIFSGSASFFNGWRLTVPEKQVVLTPDAHLTTRVNVVPATMCGSAQITGYGRAWPQTAEQQFLFAVSNRRWYPYVYTFNPWNALYLWNWRQRQPEQITYTYVPMKSFQLRWKNGERSYLEATFPYDPTYLALFTARLTYYDCSLIMREIVNGREYVRTRTLYQNFNINAIRYDEGSESASITLRLYGKQGYLPYNRTYSPQRQDLTYLSYDNGKYTIRVRPQINVVPASYVNLFGDRWQIGTITWGYSQGDDGASSFYEIAEA